MEEMDMLFYVTLILSVLAAIVLAQFIILSIKISKIEKWAGRLIESNVTLQDTLTKYVNRPRANIVHQMQQSMYDLFKRYDEDNKILSVQFIKPTPGSDDLTPKFMVVNTDNDASRTFTFEQLLDFIDYGKLGDWDNEVHIICNPKLPAYFAEAMQEYWQWANSPIETETV